MKPGGRYYSHTIMTAAGLGALALASFAACSEPRPSVSVAPAGAASTAAGGAAAAATAAVAGAQPAAAPVKYVANSGGAGVRYRIECQDSALYPGGFAEGDAVNVEQAGTGGCAGWSVVTM